jgi:hypothetical protein
LRLSFDGDFKIKFLTNLYKNRYIHLNTFT